MSLAFLGVFSPEDDGPVLPFSIIQACHAHLTELHLGSISLQNDAEAWLSFALAACKRLTRLIFHNSSGRNRSSLPLHVALECDLALTHLSWCSPSALDIAHLLPRCPRLVSLHLWPTALAQAPNDIDTLLAQIGSWCPDLMVLRVDASTEAFSPPSRRNGLQVLRLAFLASLDETLLARFIRAHRHTLLHLYLHVWLQPGTGLFHAILHTNLRTSLPLQSFDFHLWNRHGAAEPYCLSLLSFIHFCPDLRSLKLANVACDERHLLTALAFCPHLESLDLHSLSDTRADDITSEYYRIEQDSILSSTATSTPVSARLPSLKRLTVRACSGITDVWAYGIHGLASLAHISFTRPCRNGMTLRGKQCLLEKAPRLETLDWKDGNAENVSHVELSAGIRRSRRF